jgi:hypothetical protein
MSGWLGGLHVHRMERGQVPVADLLCTACGHHRRATGHRQVAALVTSDPITQHRATCPATQSLESQ